MRLQELEACILYHLRAQVMADLIESAGVVFHHFPDLAFDKRLSVIVFHIICFEKTPYGPKIL